MSIRALWYAAVLLAGSAMLAACVGGSTQAVMPPGPSPTAAPSTSPSTSPSAVPTSTPTATGGGLLVVNIPTPAPIVCSPAPVSVPVEQTVVIDCISQGYNGPFTIALSNPAVASIQPAAGTYTFFYVNGLQAGTATLSFTFAGGGAGSVDITVTP